ncbi:hypothetical protein CO661_13960 [Sinorhizobium fredii]|uniref:Uncharacterized protein n=1 Tax=Rhizobium fredii TaxID=380 RepID=A0A2A6LYG5_RHIFR|nr:hypothetical protein [Sinorhizobium fredii]PDT47282.1 hypothetical protein CO661_13960 [Sinorhizobium fredii]
MSEKIPADIENAAIELCEAHADWPAYQIVMKAMLQERKRCAEAYMHWARKMMEEVEGRKNDDA